MAKVMVINGVWTAMIVGMLAAGFMLYDAVPQMPAAYAYSQMASR